MATFEVWYCNECGKIVSHAEIERPYDDDLALTDSARFLRSTVPTMTVYPCGHLQGASTERPAGDGRLKSSQSAQAVGSERAGGAPTAPEGSANWNGSSG